MKREIHLKQTDGFVFDRKKTILLILNEAVAEPKKVVKKPSPPTKDADDDLSSIVDDWDD